METIAETTTARPSAPYVGMRPYERHERELLTGRAADARFLTDKVFSARLTLFYAPSGLGKSSVLRALVIPELERQECHTLYHDAWVGKQPEAELRQALRGLAASLGLGDAFGDAEPLANLVRLITVGGRTLVLVLDQFEEFLLNHAQRLDPLRKELATLVNAPDLDLRVLITLREEFLANLEPFHEKIVGLFQSTYRLEPLDSHAVQEAIRTPAKRFGVEYEQALLDRLVADLEVREQERREGSLASTVDLPMLQIVCTELWIAAKAKQLETLTLVFYQKLGGAKRIMDSYVRNAMPWAWWDRLFSARLMTYLAPPSGLKISYAVSDLAAMSGLDAARIESELRRLASKDVRILRVREFKAEERFELQHDALIPRVAQWRDRVLAGFALAKRSLKFVGGVLVVAGLVGLKHLYDSHELYVNSERRLETACSDASQYEESGPIFDQVANYLLGHERREVAWDKLVGILQKYENCMPASYGVDTSGYDMNKAAPAEDNWPLALRLSEEREFVEPAFLQSWQSTAALFTARSGAPLPRRLAVIKDPTFPRDFVRLESNGKKIVEAEVAEPIGAALVSIDDDSPMLAKGFHERFREKWTPWKESEQKQSPGAWWGVPRWSLPIWKAAGVKTSHRSTDVALALAWQLDKHPGHLLTDGAVRYLLARGAILYPGAAREALATVCAESRGALARLLARRQSLRHLQFAIDALSAIQPKRWPDTVRTLEQQGYFAALKLIPGETLTRPETEQPTECNARSLADYLKVDDPELGAYREMDSWLPSIASPIRAVIGDNLVRSWAPDNKNLAPWVQEAIAEMRDRFHETVGVLLPGARFRTADSEAPIDPLSFKLELLDDREAPFPARILSQGDKAGLHELLSELVRPLRARGAAFVSAYWVATLTDELRPNLKAWLKKRYSIADVTRVLRAVLLPVGPDESEKPADDQTLRHPEWLLGSLVFWEASEGSSKVADIAAFLRELQSARLSAAAGSPPQAAAGQVALAVNDLFHDRVQSAQRLLASAVRSSDTEQVRSLFIRLYAAGHRGALLASVNDRCKDPIHPAQVNADLLRADLSDLLRPGAGELPREHARLLELCRIAAYPTSRADKQGSDSATLAAAGDRPDDWSPEQALWLGQKVLTHYDPLRDPPRQRDDGATLLDSALRRMSATDKAGNAFDGLLSQCGDERKPNIWCWGVAQSLAKMLTRNPWVALNMANNLIGRVKTMGLEATLEWVDEGERRLEASNLKKADREHGSRWVRLLRADARLEASKPDDREVLEQLETEYRQFLNTTFDERARDGLTILMLNKRLAWDAAERSARDAMVRYPENAEFVARAFLAELMLGERKEAINLLKLAEDHAEKFHADDPKRDGFLFLTALGYLLTGEGRWELAGRQLLQTQHRYVNVIAIFLHNRMKGIAAKEAAALIHARWRSFDRTNWQKRMTEGDESTWLEMLLGFYLGEVPPEEFFPVLENDASYAASAFAKLRVPREGLLNDAYFYDALRRQKEKDFEGMRRSLQRVVDIRGADYYEYFMARYLLSVDPTLTNHRSD